jgi:nitrite reductase/ring-hydroxylating ferredoxin subunit/uncharacterized membrane protein
MLMRPVAGERITASIEALASIDTAAEALQRVVRKAVPQESRLKDLLSGTWLGHPVHPPLTDVVIGAWTSALLLDVFSGQDGEDAADHLVGVGALAALPTAAAGLSDWAELRGRTRRVGIAHAAGNVTALVLNASSWFARRQGNRGLGIALSAVGYGAASFSALLGGHLSFARGVGVNQTAFDEAPSEWTPVLEASELNEGQLVGAQLDGLGVLLVRKDGHIYALDDRCSHRGCALHEGRLEGDKIICPCHGSSFQLDGRLVKGPATSPQPSFDVRARDGKIEIRQRDA